MEFVGLSGKKTCKLLHPVEKEFKEGLYRIWCGVNRLGDSGVNCEYTRRYFSFC